MKISVIGLGKLGLPLAATIASRNFLVYGVDINKEVVNNLKKGKTFLNEPGLKNLIKKFKNNLAPTDKTEEAVINSEMTFVITPTPSKKNGYFSTQYVQAAVRDIAKALKSKKNYHLVVIVSTVMPGSTDKIKKLLEKESGKVCGRDFGLCYNPEFIALGSVIYNLLNPDFILIGESDQTAGDMLQKFYQKYCDNKPKFARMNFVNAELTKISVNTYITTKISYANMLCEICEQLPGGDVDAVTAALGLDSRIGQKYLKGGPAFGGPCFPRDNIAFISLAKKTKTNFHIPLATHKTNVRQTERLVKKVLEFTKNGLSVGILGLSYKPFTDVVEESFGMVLAKELISKKVNIYLHDPLALENVKKVFNNSMNYESNIKSCIKKSQILVIATDWPEYKGIKKGWFGVEPKILIDPWRIIDVRLLPKNVSYQPFGISVLE
ncbi:UDP-glucose/GDP-mannose dehydrogenase family protein [Candidatus Daviesbacteria bacterium]|nr:UDP-glucose/GDP-mannose dehydrogenase family protein [Candidatus Daviesbacteria bacterium]